VNSSFYIQSFYVEYYSMLGSSRGRHRKRYSLIAIMLCYVFALLHNALYLWRIVIASDSYRFRLFVGIIPSTMGAKTFFKLPR
jgi:hypothetical protein